MCAPLPPLGVVYGSCSRSAPGESWTLTKTSSDWSWTLQERPPWRWPCPWASGSKGADPVVGGCGVRALQPCLGLLGPQEPSPRRRMGSGVSTQVGSVHQCQRDREKPPGPKAGQGGWSLWGAKVLPSEFLEHSPRSQVKQTRPWHYPGRGVAGGRQQHIRCLDSAPGRLAPPGAAQSSRCPERPHQPVQSTSLWGSEMQTSDHHRWKQITFFPLLKGNAPAPTLRQVSQPPGHLLSAWTPGLKTGSGPKPLPVPVAFFFLIRAATLGAPVICLHRLWPVSGLPQRHPQWVRWAGGWQPPSGCRDTGPGRHWCPQTPVRPLPGCCPRPSWQRVCGVTDSRDWPPP